MPGLADLLANPTLQQLFVWQVAAAVVQAALAPFLTEVQSSVNAAAPTVPLSPADAAEAVVRNVLSPEQAAAEAAKSGISAERFAVLQRLAGNAPDPTSLAVALRRGLIDEARYREGIRQGRLRDEWADLVRQLSVAEPSPSLALTAALTGQIDEGEARRLYERWGADPQYWDLALATEGTAPTPEQALELANRGIIPWTGRGMGVVSYEQAFLEGPWRNKWLEPFRALAEYLPPPRTVTAMYREGSLSRQEAIDLLRKQGLSESLAAAYLRSGSSQKAERSRDLGQSTILEMYRDRLIDAERAAEFLGALGYDEEEVGALIAVEDLRLAQRAVTAAVGRIRSLYVGHRIDAGTAASTLAQLDVPASQIDELIEVWSLERAANVRTLTPADIVGAFRLEIIDQAEAIAELQALGYTAHDAWLYLSVHVKRALPDEPPRGT